MRLDATHILLAATLSWWPVSLAAQAADGRKPPRLESTVDASITPGDDFFAYANGAWLKATALPLASPIIRKASASGSAQIIDARPADRFRGEAPEPRAGVASGHIPGSLNLPFPQIIENGQLKSPQDIAKAFVDAGADLSKPIITSCGSGVSASILAVALEEAGHKVKSIYDGSWAEWGSVAGQPVATGKSKP